MRVILDKFIFLLFIFLGIFNYSCESDNQSKSIVKEDSDKVVIKDTNDVKIEELLKTDTFPRISYHQIVVRDKEQLDSLRNAFPDSEENPALNKMFCLLNRKERRYLKVADTVLVADSLVPDMVAYSIFPRVYPGAVNIPKIVMVSNAYQAYACYEYGKQVRFAATNTGKEKTQTYPGRYAMVWKQELRLSSLDSTWKMPYTWNIHRFAGSAFHKFTMPGYPASHSCLRQFMDDAKWLYKWGKGAKYDTSGVAIHLTGTPVLIIDHFDFNRPRTGPWVALRSNKDTILQLPEKPMEFEEALIPISQIPKSTRGILPNRHKYLYAEDTLRARGVIREGVTITVSVDFNLERRKKAARRAQANEQKKSEEAINQTSNPLDDEQIKKNLEELEKKPE